MDDDREPARQRILRAAAEILERDGVQAVSTRTVASAAGIRAASLYQLFGDKDGLMAALAAHAFDTYLGEKAALAPSDDPVEDLRRGWDFHVAFGLAHPDLYLVMYGTERPGRRPPAADEARTRLLTALERTAAAGALRLPVPFAAELLMASTVGTVLSLLGRAEPERDLTVSTTMRDLVVDAVSAAAPMERDPTVATRALALDAVLGEPDDLPLSTRETALLREWLARLAR